MRHPPIPPNCPYLEMRDDEVRLLLNYACYMPIDSMEPACARALIAALAEVGWLRESERIASDDPMPSDRPSDAWFDAQNNANAWRDWGGK